MKNRTKLEATAYHEAGHAVVSYFHKRRFRFVTIKPKPGYDILGRVVGRASDYHRRVKMAERGYITGSTIYLAVRPPHTVLNLCENSG